MNENCPGSLWRFWALAFGTVSARPNSVICCLWVAMFWCLAVGVWVFLVYFPFFSFCWEYSFGVRIFHFQCFIYMWNGYYVRFGFFLFFSEVGVVGADFGASLCLFALFLENSPFFAK